jgi:outer membrane protein assembly factor BamE (lipoprotein component of BamABCDE complex)
MLSRSTDLDGLTFMQLKRLSIFLYLPLLVLSLLGGCAQYENKRGVKVSWDDSITSSLVRGDSTRKDVLAALGPPSQVIALENETAMYYLFEHSRGAGVILILYNRINIDTRYDRAIFFFDEDDVLTDYSTRVYDSSDE